MYFEIIQTQNKRPNNIQTSLESYKTQIKIFASSGLAQDFEQPDPEAPL